MEPRHQTCAMLGQGHYERTQDRLTYNWAYTKNEDLVCPGLNSDHVRPCRLNRPDHILVSLSYLLVDSLAAENQGVMNRLIFRQYISVTWGFLLHSPWWWQ